uniref:response regulator transcription factor n=1 Tax=uncultured Altererythrobacter sp. TaxID=500840 RepID=UPI00263408C8|nr:response regulator transcription factor [uncultured Altererythrobacter sp.]
MRIAVADDERELLDQLAGIMQAAGHQIFTFRNGLDLINALKRETFDVVLADWNMPQRTGLEVINWMRDNLSPLPPFIMITSRQDSGDIVKALEAGAIDYIVKPEDNRVILARVEAAGRRSGANQIERVAKFGDYELDRQSKSVTIRDREIALTNKEFDLVDLLFQNRDRPLSRGYLLSRVWGSSEDLETRTIDVHVSRLRAKLDLQPENGFVIRTVFGFGYRMDEVVENS